MNEQNILRECEKLVYEALYSSDRQVKINTLLYLKQHVYGIDNELTEHWEEWKKQEQGRTFTSSYILLSPDKDLNQNLEYCIDIINEKLNRYYNVSVSNNAIRTIFFSPRKLSNEDVIYSTQDKKLTVSDFLSVLDYAKKFSEAYLGADYEKYSEALLAIKTVDLALHHKKEDKPLNKTLHLLNNILTECAKRAHEEDENSDGKRIVSGISLIIDLAIDFLVGK